MQKSGLKSGRCRCAAYIALTVVAVATMPQAAGEARDSNFNPQCQIGGPRSSRLALEL